MTHLTKERIEAALRWLNRYPAQIAVPEMDSGHFQQSCETIKAALTHMLDPWQDISTHDGTKSPVFIYSQGLRDGRGVIYVGWLIQDRKFMVFDTGRGENASVIATHWSPMYNPPKSIATDTN